MRIAVASVISWPYVRRGSRFPYELATYLAGQGHEVHYLTTKPGDVSRTKMLDGFTAEYHRLRENLFLTALRIEKLDTFTWSCLLSLLRHEFDVVQTIFPMDAFAANLNRSLKGTPFVHLMIDGFQQPYYITRHGERMLRRAAKNASRLVVISQYVNRDIQEHLGLQGMVIPVTVDTRQFFPGPQKKMGAPRILFTSSLIDPRKRFFLLLKAFEFVLREVPDATLQLAGHCHPLLSRHMRQQVGEKVFQSIEIRGVGERKDLPALYRGAAVTVLPSMREAFGMVLLESLASGTPVVGTRSGGIPEVINDPGIGVLFEPEGGAEELAEAILKGLRLARDPEVPSRCARHVEPYSWQSIGPRYESLYEDILRAAKPRAKRREPVRDACGGKMPADPPTPWMRGTGSLGRRLRRGFSEAMDGLDITYDTYFEIMHHEPRCLFALRWLARRGIRGGKALVAGPALRPFSLLARQVGFSVAGNGLAEEGGPFDLIILDEPNQDPKAFKHLVEQAVRIISPGGILVLMIQNACRILPKLHRTLEEGVQPFTGVFTAHPGPPGAPRPREIAKVLSQTGFSLIDRRYVSGRRISGGFLSLPFRFLLLKHLICCIHRLWPPCRSHLFIAARVPSRPSGKADRS